MSAENPIPAVQSIRNLVVLDKGYLRYANSPEDSPWGVHEPGMMMTLLSHIGTEDRLLWDPDNDSSIHERAPLIPHGRIMKAPEGEMLGNMGLFRQYKMSETHNVLTAFHPKRALLVGALSQESLYELLSSFTELGWDDTDIDIVDPAYPGIGIIEALRETGWSWKGNVRTYQMDICDFRNGSYDFISADIVSAYAISRYNQYGTGSPYDKYHSILLAVKRLLDNDGVFLSRTLSMPVKSIWKPVDGGRGYLLISHPIGEDEYINRRNKLIELLGTEIVDTMDQDYLDYCLRYGPFPLRRPEPMCGLAYLSPHKYAPVTTSFEEKSPVKFRAMYGSVFGKREELMVWDEKRQWLLQTFIVSGVS